MIRRATFAVTLAALLVAGASAAQDPGTAPDPATEPSESVAVDADELDNDMMKIVCRRVQPPTGTRIISGQTRQHMCMSRADWEQMALDAQDVLNERDRGVCAPDCGS